MKKLSLIFFAIILFPSWCFAGFKSDDKKRLEKNNSFNYLYDFSSYHSYGEYQKNYLQAVKNLRPNLNEKELNYLVPADKSPSCSKNNKTAILLIHGLSDSPFSMSDIKKLFNDNCFFTRLLIIPGHALVPGALLSVSYQDQINAVDFALNDLKKNFDQVIIVGLSNGAALAINQVYTRKDNFIKALIIFSPVIKIDQLEYGWWVAKLMSYLGNYVGEFAWYKIRKDEDTYKYESFPYKAIYEIYRLITINKKLAAKNNFSIPLFVALSDVDQTVNSKAVIEWFNKAKGKKEMIVYSNSGKEDNNKIKYVKTRNLNKKILDLSHISIPINKNNYYCGEKNPIYLNCLHYYEDKINYQKCKDPQNKTFFNGETTLDNLQNYPLRRISYNPFFKDLGKQIISFIEN